MRLRGFLEELKDERELNVTDEQVSWDLEAGSLAALNVELDGPAIQFANITDFPGMSLVSGLYASPTDLYPKRRKAWIRANLAMGQDRNMSFEELQDFWHDAYEQEGIRALQSTGGPCKEVVLTGEQVDLFAYPFPIIHEQDGGRYSSQHIIIVNDPETNRTWWTDEPLMIKDRTSVLVKLLNNAFSPLNSVYQKYVKKNLPMPFAIAYGCDSTVPLGAALSMERIGLGGHTAEPTPADIAGYLQGEPVELVKAQTSGLLVPAHAEMILEGEAYPGQTGIEGPYPDFYKIQPASQQPLFRIKTITRRKNPIIPFDVTGIKGSDSLTLRSLAHSFKIRRILNTWWWGTKIAKWVYTPVCMRLGLCIVACNALYPGFEFHFTRIVNAYSMWFDKVLLVDGALGAEELARVMQDFIQKASPVHGFHFSKDHTAAPVAAAKYALAPGETTGRMYVNATLDPTWPKELLPTRVSFETTWPKDIQEKVMSSWKKMGFINEPQHRLIAY